MEFQFETMLEKITSFMKSEAKTDTVIGKEFKLGEFSCIPVIRVGMGFGTGGGEGDDKNHVQVTIHLTPDENGELWNAVSDEASAGSE